MNGWEEHYQEKSFLFQCKERFGADVGEEVWEECNQSFDRLPLAAVIDHEIFCIHGGFPRPVPSHHKTEIQAILAIPHLVAIMPAYDHEVEWMKQVATDCIWSDPASEEMESVVDEVSGFGESPRGGGAVCFGSRARQPSLGAIFTASKYLRFQTALTSAYRSRASARSLGALSKLAPSFCKTLLNQIYSKAKSTQGQYAAFWCCSQSRITSNIPLFDVVRAAASMEGAKSRCYDG